LQQAECENPFTAETYTYAIGFRETTTRFSTRLEFSFAINGARSITDFSLRPREIRVVPPPGLAADIKNFGCCRRRHSKASSFHVDKGKKAKVVKHYAMKVYGGVDV
jgi:hypothetical protein